MCVKPRLKVNVEKNQWDIEFGVRNVERGTSCMVNQGGVQETDVENILMI